MFEDSVYLNPTFLLANSSLVGQMAHSVVIGLLLKTHVRNKTPVNMSEFQFQRLPRHLIHRLKLIRKNRHHRSYLSPQHLEIHAKWICGAENNIFSTYQQKPNSSRPQLQLQCLRVKQDIVHMHCYVCNRK